jgi:hypothetical protein
MPGNTEVLGTMTAVSRRLDGTPESLSDTSLGKDVQYITEDDRIPEREKR